MEILAAYADEIFLVGRRGRDGHVLVDFKGGFVGSLCTGVCDDQLVGFFGGITRAADGDQAAVDVGGGCNGGSVDGDGGVWMEAFADDRDVRSCRRSS